MNSREETDRVEEMDRNRKNEQENEQAFEQALTRSLRRVDAPGDLMARVLAQVEEAESRKQAAASWVSVGREWLRSYGWLGWKPVWGAMAAMLVASVLTGHVVHEHRIEQQERARVQASREFDVSVQITDKALERAREQLRRAGVALEEK